MYTYRKLTPEEQQELVETRIKSGVPAHQPPHPATDAQYYLLSASCYEHKPIVNVPERRELLLSLLVDHVNAGRLVLIAWVVLPNHYHLLAQVDDFAVLGNVFKSI